MSNQFPDDVRDPNRKGPNPFAADHWDGPGEMPPQGGGEDEPVVAQPAAGAYSTTSHAADYAPNDYEAYLTPRSGRIWLLSLIGLALNLAASVSFAMAVSKGGLGAAMFVGEFILLIFLGLAFSVPAWLMGSSDQMAIASGAMQPINTARLRRGHVLGIFGTAIGILTLACIVVVTIGWQ